MDTIKIAIADDQLLFRKGLSSILETFPGLDLVFEAENGQILLDNLAASQPDVVLLDLKMPVLNGIEASKAILRDFPHIKIIMLSTHGDEQFILRTMELGVSGYLLKDASPDELEKAVSTVMSDGIYLNKHISSILVQNLQGKLPKRQKLNDHTLKPQLTDREVEVLDLICKGLTTAEIAEKLFISVNTVDGHRKNLFEKTGVKNAVSLAVYSIKNELVKL